MSSRAEFAASLTQAREAAGLTVRELARRLGTPAGTLGDYFSGRHIPSTAQVPLLRSALAECGVTDPADLDRWVAALRRVRAFSDRRISRPPVPYRGLTSFEPEDAALFFGRDEQTGDILERLAALRTDPGPSGGLLVVVGPSGSGKSSLLRAGVVATIRAGASEPSGDRWTCAVTTPGTDPVGSFTSAALGQDGDVRVVVIDQFEELFTSADAPARQRFLAALPHRDPGVLVVLGMRADFYSAAARESYLLPALQHAQVLVAPMTPDQLRAAILGPAEAVGARVEDGLVDLVLADLAPHGAGNTAHDAGALPLMSHALLATWERATGARLTIADYRSTGGIDAAVQRTAEEVYAGLDADERHLARRMFLRLVHLDDDVAVTRRRVTREELTSLVGDDAERVEGLVDRFVERRLLTTSAQFVGITHEALLSAWPRLRDWVDADLAGLRLHRQITEGTNAWLRADRDESLLLRGGRLETATEWAADPDHGRELNRGEGEFLQAGRALRDAQRAGERTRRRRLQQALTAVAALAVLAGILAAVSMTARKDADRARVAAAASRDNAQSRQIAFQSRELAANDPALAQQLALVAFRISHTEEALGTLIDESAKPVLTRVLGAQGPTPLAVSRDGALLAVGHADDGSVRLYRRRGTTPPALQGTIPGAGGHAEQLYALAFSPDGKTLVTGGQPRTLQLWDVADPAHPRRLTTVRTGFTGAVETAAISPDGRTLAAGSGGPHPVQEWDLSATAAPRPLPPPDGIPAQTVIQSVAFDAGSTMLAAGGSQGTVLTWPRASAATTRPRTAHASTWTVDALSFVPGHDTLLAGDRAGVTTAWTTATPVPRRTHTLAGATDSPVNVLAVSPDGRYVAIGSADNTLREVDIATWTIHSATGNPGPVTGVAYSPDGATILTTAADGTLRLWRPATRSIPISGTAFDLVYSHDGSRLAVVTNGSQGAVRLWDARDAAHPRPLGPPLTMTNRTQNDGSGALSPNGDLAAGGNSAGQVELWDTTVPAHPQVVAAPFAAAGALVESLVFSPDGRMLAVASDDHTVRLWDVGDPRHPRRVASVQGGDLMLNAAFSPNGRLLVGANADSTARLWSLADVHHPRQISRLGGFKSYVYGANFSPDGRRIAVTSSDHTTRLWTIHGTGRPTPFGAALIGPTDYVYSDSFSPDGRQLAAASNDGAVRLYDVRGTTDPVPVETLHGVSGPVFSVAFSPDGTTLVAGGRSSGLALWTANAESYADAVCPAAGDPITRQEWSLYVPGKAYDPPCR